MSRELTGLFLGAGASCEIGMPLVWELTGKLLGWLTPAKLRELNAGWQPQGGGHSGAVIEDLASLLTRKDMHYESVLGYLETQFKRDKSVVQQREYHSLYSWLVEMVWNILCDAHVRNVGPIERRLPLLDGIARMAPANAPLWIFSLNHDLIVECVAARHNIPLNCGFSQQVITLPCRDGSGVKKGELRAQVISKEELENSRLPFFQHGQQGINLLKIHGALDVFTFRDGKELLKLLPVESSVAGVLETLRAANEDLFYPDPDAPDGKVKTMNEIAYMDDAGEMQFLRRSLLAGAYKFDPYRDQVLPKRLLEDFRQHIRSVSSLVCIGYGFGDIHINEIMRDWLGLSAARRVEIVCPGIATIPPFLQHLAPQVVLTDSCATEYLDQRTGIVRTPAENLERKFDVWARGRGKVRAIDELAAFKREYHVRILERCVERTAQLPMRDGDVDVDALGGSPEAVGRRIAVEAVGTLEDLLESFLASRDRNEVAEAAYFRWVGRGGGHGLDTEDWLVAEATLRSRPR